MLTEIGTLVTIVKGLLDATKTGSELFGLKKKRAPDAVTQMQERIMGIANQLHQSVALSKMLPIWLKDQSEFDLFQSNLADSDVRLLDSGLRRLIDDSIHDHFSGTFFRTSFASLPGIEAAIREFRGRLQALETQLNGIPPGDAEAWRRAWPILKMRLHDLRMEAVKINNAADEIHSSLIKELQDAGQAA